jgi:hypothetical protein
MPAVVGDPLRVPEVERLTPGGKVPLSLVKEVVVLAVTEPE